MSTDIALHIENVSKQYRLGTVGTGTLSHDLNRWWASIRGKEDPYLKVGESNDRTSKGTSDYVWALKDVNFEIKQGDAVGIIGRNGAGKSTLLKLLSRVTKPTTGSIKYKGRIASLLEVGTGFHPEMTGRENIYLNGAILGMTKKEITRKFDEIVDFSGVERYVDTPVKRYSSGMYVRLAFAVAAHLESEILIVDEVLAVGDAEFQKKCLGKMGDVSKGEGRTVLFVSHHMDSVRQLCNTGIFMDKGTVKSSGAIGEIIREYNQQFLLTFTSKFYSEFVPKTNDVAQLTEIEFVNRSRDLSTDPICDVFDDIAVRVQFQIYQRIASSTPILWIKKDDSDLFWSFMTDLDQEKFEGGFLPGAYNYEIKLPELKKGKYSVNFVIGRLKVQDFDRQDNVLSFEVDEKSFNASIMSFSGPRLGQVPFITKWIEV